VSERSVIAGTNDSDRERERERDREGGERERKKAREKARKGLDRCGNLNRRESTALCWPRGHNYRAASVEEPPFIY